MCQIQIVDNTLMSSEMQYGGRGTISPKSLQNSVKCSFGHWPATTGHLQAYFLMCPALG